jgi:hypothetical protein
VCRVVGVLNFSNTMKTELLFMVLFLSCAWRRKWSLVRLDKLTLVMDGLSFSVVLGYSNFTKIHMFQVVSHSYVESRESTVGPTSM